jgi:hypothetical protein
VSASVAGKRLVKPLLEKARAHESQMLRTLAVSEQAALKKLLAKLAGGKASESRRNASR